MISDDWDEMEFALLAATMKLAEEKAERFLENTRPDRAWNIVMIVEAID